MSGRVVVVDRCHRPIIRDDEVLEKNVVELRAAVVAAQIVRVGGAIPRVCGREPLGLAFARARARSRVAANLTH